MVSIFKAIYEPSQTSSGTEICKDREIQQTEVQKGLGAVLIKKMKEINNADMNIFKECLKQDVRPVGRRCKGRPTTWSDSFSIVDKKLNEKNN